MEKMDKKEREKERDRILEGLKKSHARMLRFKKEKGTPLVISRNGKIVKIPPEEFHTLHNGKEGENK